MAKKSDLIPRDKFDLQRVEALKAAGPEAAVPILDELMKYLQDINWPVAAPLAAYLSMVGEPLVPAVKKVLKSGDDMWIYWVLQHVVAAMPKDLIAKIKTELYWVATDAENDMVALRIGRDAGIWRKDELDLMVKRKLAAYEEFVTELKSFK